MSDVQTAASAQAPADEPAIGHTPEPEPPIEPTEAATSPGQPPQPPGRTVVIPGEVLLNLMESGIAGMEARLVEMRVSPMKLAEFHVNRAALLLSGLDHPAMRGQAVGQIMAGFAAAVEAFHTAIHSQGGIIIPNGAMRAGLRL